jgi:hypothetical protein
MGLNRRLSPCLFHLLVIRSVYPSSSYSCLVCFVVRSNTGLSTMFVSWSLLALPAILLLATLAEADSKPYISIGAELRTECKTCPRSLCPNQLYYDYEESLNVTCWTRGTKIMGDRLWLKSTSGCYVTQYDLYEYTGECENCLPSNSASTNWDCQLRMI